MARRKPGEISDVQFARMSEREVWKLLTGPAGALEVSWPGSDDERIDMETHVKWTFGLRLALQIKAHSWLHAPESRPTLVIKFDEKLHRVHSHPLFCYLLRYFPLNRLPFHTPPFLLHSARLHP